VKYEDLITDPDHEQERIADYLGLEIVVPFSECYKYASRFKSHGLVVEKSVLGKPISPTTSRMMPKLNKVELAYFKKVLDRWGNEIRDIMPEFGYDVDTLP